MASATVIYDADCGFCKACLAVLLVWDRRSALRPLPLGTAEADELLSDLPPAARITSWHLIEADGRRHSAGAAFAPTLRLLRGGRIPASVFARFPRTTERGYRWVTGHRSFLGRFVPGRARRWADGVITRSS